MGRDVIPCSVNLDALGRITLDPGGLPGMKTVTDEHMRNRTVLYSFVALASQFGVLVRHLAQAGCRTIPASGAFLVLYAYFPYWTKIVPAPHPLFLVYFELGCEATRFRRQSLLRCSASSTGPAAQLDDSRFFPRCVRATLIYLAPQFRSELGGRGSNLGPTPWVLSQQYRGSRFS